MPGEEKNRSVLGQIATTVIVAILVGGTAPWWWHEVFPPRQGDAALRSQVSPLPQPNPDGPSLGHPSGSSNSSDQGPGPTPNATPEDLSRTPESLPGDAITHFRVTKLEGRELVIEVDYSYNAQHGNVIGVGATPQGVRGGYTPTWLPPARAGTVALNVSVLEAGSCSALEIFLFEYARPSEPFARRTFPYHMSFE